MARSASIEYPTNGVAAPMADELEPRVRRLEQAVAALQDTQLMEDRVVERVAHRVEERGGSMLAPSGGLLASATRLLMPADAPAYDLPPGDPNATKPGWLLIELWNEFRTILRMFADYRFRFSWMGRVVPLACIVVYILSWILFADRFWIFGNGIDRIIAALAVVVVYKTYAREAHRYNDLLQRIRYR